MTKFDETRFGNGDIYIALLDLKDAFGSIPQSALMAALESAKAGPAFTKMAKAMYAELSSAIMSYEGATEKIPLNNGIKEGSPLSSLLFNLAFDSVVRLAQGEGKNVHRALAYADDLTVLSDDREVVQVVALAERIKKSATLHLCGRKPVGDETHGLSC